jgi:hypothetical protein
MIGRMIKPAITALAGALLAVAPALSPAQEAAASRSSISPDKQWEYRCEPFGGLGQCAPVILKAGTDEEVVDLDTELSITGPDAPQTEVIWAPDSKRFACNYSPAHTHDSVYVTTAFYQLQGDKWVALESPSDEASSRLQLAQLGEGRLPKDFNAARCSKMYDVLKVRSWPDASRAIVYAPCGRADGETKTAFLFT